MNIKHALIVSVAMAALSASGSAFSQEAHDLIPEALLGAKVSTRTDAASLAAPVGVQLAPLLRLWNPKQRDRVSMYQMPDNWEDLGWVVEGTLGYVSYYSAPGFHPIYSCFTGKVPGDKIPDFFSSIDPNCEGETLAPASFQPIGFLADTQIEGTVPLYRCDTPNTLGDHFDTTSPVCEGNKPGAVLNGILGYIFL